jgi:hypothetical protein
MDGFDWHKCRFLESGENLKPLVKRRFGREPSTSHAREIAACLQQGRLFYEAAASSPLEIRPLQMFYGMVGFSKALAMAQRAVSLSALRRSHGLVDISQDNSRIAELRLRIGTGGTFQDFNDVVADLTRVCYIDGSTRPRAIYLPSAKSDQLCGIELSLREILGHIPYLESLYQLTFGEEAQTGFVFFEADIQDDKAFWVRIDDCEPFSDLESLKRIVTRWRARFPFLTAWRLNDAEHAWGKSIIRFRNICNADVEEFSEKYFDAQDRTFEASAQAGMEGESFAPEEGLSGVASRYPKGGDYAFSPVRGCFLSEFSFQYLALFLLSSLVRYRPHTWIHAISRSVMPEAPADDQALSLIERFLDLNSGAIPAMVVVVLNPSEDQFA